MKKILLVIGAVSAACGVVLLAAGLARLGERPAKLIWATPDVKSALMTVGYKIYANRTVEQGRHYLSKLVFRNEGEHPVTDFSISYKIDDYIDWTEPETRKQIPPGFSFVELYYPRLPASVSKLRNAATTTLRTRIRWKEDGKEREETMTRDLVLRAVNEIAYCDVPQSDAVTFFDYFSASAFCVAMATPNDPVVSLYVSEITKLAGGTTAGIAGGPQEVKRLCEITYDYMVRSGLRYAGDSGVPATFDNIATSIQTVRLPRDVIINNQGLCIELSLLWCSILEHLGVRTVMFLVPGHAFVLAYAPEQGMPLQNGLPIECTAITPRAVGRDAPVPFDDAVKMAAQLIQQAYKDGRIIPLNIRDCQAQGFVPPELPDIDTGKLADTLAARIGGGGAGYAAAPVRGVPVDESAAPAPLEPADNRGGGAAPAPNPGGSDSYADPSGRFQLQVAPGWQAAPIGDRGEGGVAVSRGECSILISPFGGVQHGQQVVMQLVQQLAPQFRNLQMIAQDRVIFGGRQASLSRFTGISPKGTPTRLTVAGVDPGADSAFAVIISLPEAVYQTERSTVDQMMRSFQFNP